MLYFSYTHDLVNIVVYRQYHGVLVLVTTESYDEMQQTLPEAVIGKTCNDLVARCFLKPIISRSAPSHIRSTIRKFCCLSVVCGPSIWYDTEICGCGVNYILPSHGRWVSLYPPRVTVSFKWYQPSANALGWYHLKLTVTLGGYNDQYPPRVTVSFKWYPPSANASGGYHLKLTVTLGGYCDTHLPWEGSIY